MKFTKLKEHSVIYYIQPHLVSYLRKCDPENTKSVRPTEKEHNAFEIIFGLSNITECMDQLYYAIDLISGFRKSTTHDSMNRHDYIVCSTENVLFRITSVFDRCLRLSNKVYDIGIPDRECRDSTIINNSKIKGTVAGKTLKKLNKFTSEFRTRRNEIAHANCFNDKELNEIQGFYLLDSNDPEVDGYKHMFKAKADSYVASKQKEYLGNVVELEELVSNYFSAIQPKIEIIIEGK